MLTLTKRLAITALMAASCIAQAGQLAIVIDDIGYDLTRGLRVLDLPAEITIAVLPSAPHTPYLVSQANARQRDVIIHQPMEPHAGHHVHEENDTLKLNMSGQEFDAIIERALNAIPTSIGLSNHTGSLLTTHRQSMQRLMGHLAQRQLFFLDSRTTPDTVALEVALEIGIPALRRDVFLDHDTAPDAVAKQFQRAIHVARRQGHSLLIGHPHEVSIQHLEQSLSRLPADIELVSAASLAKYGGAFSERQRPFVNRPASYRPNQ